MNKIIHAFGVPSSPWGVSSVLETLGVSHSLISGAVRVVNTEKHIAKRQPAWPIVLPSINAVSRYKSDYGSQILLICDSEAMLKTCNVRLLKQDDLVLNLQKALEYAVANPIGEWKLQRLEPSISDYVENATKPSFLNHIQTQLYKISNYDLRKETQAMIIGCLAGIEAKPKLLAKLKTSYKLDALLALVKDTRFDALKAAVAMYTRTQSIAATTTATGFEGFEILYISRSSSLTQAKKK